MIYINNNLSITLFIPKCKKYIIIYLHIKYINIINKICN